MNTNFTKEEEQAIKAMETLSNYCLKRENCENCIFAKGRSCVIHDRDYLPEDWTDAFDEGNK